MAASAARTTELEVGMHDVGHDASLQQELVALEDCAWQALSEGRGAQFYEQHLTGDALMVFEFGVLSRDEALATMQAAPPWAQYHLTEARLIRLTADSALLTYHATAQRTGQEPYTARMTTGFVRRDNRWQTVFHQQTPSHA
jgi:hypothetical protein